MPRRPKKREQPAKKYVLPPPILNATPEEIAHVTLNAKPPKKWRYMEEAKVKKRPSLISGGKAKPLGQRRKRTRRSTPTPD